MDNLARWVRAQLDEDERIARAASWADDANAWHAEPSPFDARGRGQRWFVEDAMEEGVVTRVDPAASDDEGVARHIATHDPARVLREIDAKRQLLELHQEKLEQGYGSDFCAECGFGESSRSYYPCGTLRLLAVPYEDRPGYRDDWRP